MDTYDSVGLIFPHTGEFDFAKFSSDWLILPYIVSSTNMETYD